MPELKLSFISHRPPTRFNSYTHSHEFYELGIVAEGKCTWILDRTKKIRLKENDFILLPPGQIHSEESLEDIKIKLIWVGFSLSSEEKQRVQQHLLCKRQTNPVVALCLKQLMLQINREHSIQDIHAPEIVKHYLDLLFLQLQRAQAHQTPASSTKNLESREDQRLSIVQSAARYLENNLEKSLNIALVARYFSISTPYFTALFRKHFKIPPSQYLLERRLIKSKDLLMKSRDPIKTVAHKCGFTDTAHFCKRFKRKYHTTPRGFRVKSNL